MIVECTSCEEEFEVDATKLPPRRVKSKCLKCGAWIYLNEGDGSKSAVIDAPNLDEGEEMLKLGRLEEAGDLFQKAMKLSPSPEVGRKVREKYLIRSSELASQGKTEEARDVAKAGLQLFEDHPGLWALLGDVYIDFHEIEKAKKAYRKAIELDPKDEKFYISLANIYHDKRQPEEEVKIYKEAIRNLPKSSIIHLKLAQALLYKGDYVKALQVGKAAVKLDKSNKGAIRFFKRSKAIKNFAKAVGLFKKKKFEESMKVFKAVESTLSSYPLLPYYKGVCHYMLREFNEAIVSLEKYLHLDAHGPKTEKALSFLQRAIRELRGMEIKVLLHPLDECHLIIKTSPPGARLSLNGETLGKSPQNLHGVSTGQHFLKAELGDTEMEVPLILSGGIAYKIILDLSQEGFVMEPSLDYEVVQT